MTLLVRGATHEFTAKPPTKPGAHAEGTSTATGTYAHAEGNGNAASADYAHAEGTGNTASGQFSHAEGTSCTASADAAHCEGYSGTASGAYSHAEGMVGKATREGQYAHGTTGFATTAQAILLVMGVQTVGTTPGLLCTSGFNGGTAQLTGAGTNVLTIPIRNAYAFRIEVVARRTDAQGEMAAWWITGLAARDATGNARIVGTPTVATFADAGASAWTFALSINTGNATNNYLALTATGEAAKSITWIAALHATEVLTST